MREKYFLPNNAQTRVKSERGPKTDESGVSWSGVVSHSATIWTALVYTTICLEGVGVPHNPFNYVVRYFHHDLTEFKGFAVTLDISILIYFSRYVFLTCYFYSASIPFNITNSVSYIILWPPPQPPTHIFLLSLLFYPTHASFLHYEWLTRNTSWVWKPTLITSWKSVRYFVAKLEFKRWTV